MSVPQYWVELVGSGGHQASLPGHHCPPKPHRATSTHSRWRRRNCSMAGTYQWMARFFRGRIWLQARRSGFIRLCILRRWRKLPSQVLDSGTGFLQEGRGLPASVPPSWNRGVAATWIDGSSNRFALVRTSCHHSVKVLRRPHERMSRARQTNHPPPLIGNHHVERYNGHTPVGPQNGRTGRAGRW